MITEVSQWKLSESLQSIPQFSLTWGHFNITLSFKLRLLTWLSFSEIRYETSYTFFIPQLSFMCHSHKENSVASVRKRIIPTERPPLVSEVRTNFFADRGYHVVSVTNPYDCILGFLDRSSYYFFQVAPHLYSRG
jgi:hypothetical protein